jgi:hypothetical protein
MTMTEAEPKLPNLRLVICRSDLPPNPNWEREGYPNEYCWDVVELFLEAEKNPELRQVARRIFWEAMWREYGRYKRGRPFFDVYVCNVAKRTCVPVQVNEQVRNVVLEEIIATAFETKIAHRGWGLFRMLFGHPILKHLRELLPSPP